ncbi:MAG: AraC family ligand binding domain-containing protein, partial [Clostridia bacterium]|nr:AraC family ligand binding domain-containing protein [Clostridia bacterium]
MIYEAYRSMTSNQLSYLHHRDLDYPEHMHYSFEIHLVTEGVMRCTVSGTEYLLHPGEAVLILPNEPHEYMHPGPTAGVTVVFSVDYVADFTNATRGSRLKTSLFHPDPALLSDDLTEVNRFLQVGRLNMLCGSALAECG